METSHSQPTLVTLHDAVTDSPVYRANVLHFDEQLDLLDKWLDQLSKHLKLYTDKLTKFNLETNNVCKKTIPVGIDSVLIDPNFTGAVIRSFSDALQTSLAFKTKLVSDLEDNFIQPLAQFVKTNLKEFRDFRKQHEKALERYEAQLYKYTSQSKTKEASAIREEAFRLHEARKAYTRMSGQHVIRMLQFRSMLEHCLVESFSAATLAHFHDVDGGKQVWSKLDAGLNAWKQWLIDDRKTCDYQLHRLQVARKQLQSEHIQQTQPLRDLDRYGPVSLPSSLGTAMTSRHSLDFSNITPSNTADEKTSANKWGYLFTRVSRMSWIRKWFFLHDGYFGTCQVNTNPKLKGAITVGERVSVLLCDIKPMADQDRRFCFEVVCVQQSPFILQAETEEEMRDWIASFANAKRFMLENEQLHLHTNPPTASSPSATTSDHEINSSSESDSPRPTRNSMPLLQTATDSALSLPATASASTTTNTPSITSTVHSAVLLSTSADNQDQVSLATSTTLTPLLVHEAVKAQQPPTNPPSSSPPTSPAAPSQSFATAMSSSVSQQQAQQHQHQQSNGAGGAATWGIPWGLVPNMFSGASAGTGDEEIPATPMSPTAATSLLSSGVDSEGHPIIWPTRLDDTTPKVDLTGYSPELESRNRELRVLFGGVSSNEVVLDAFISSLKKKPVEDEQDDSSNDDVSSPVTPTGFVDPLEQELSAQLSGSVQRPQSEFGYSYTGRAFITQETFWYYSSILMTCVNTIAIPLKNIKAVRLIRDTSIADCVSKNGKANNLALAIDMAERDEPLVLMTLLDDVEVVAERLRFAVENAKSAEPMPLQILYDVLHSMSASVNKSQTTQVIQQQKKSEPAVVQPTPEVTTAEIYQSEPPIASPVPEPKKKRKGRKSSASNKPIPKSGALAAAMMAATVAGGSGFFDASKMVNMEEVQKRGSSSSNSKKTTMESSDSISSGSAFNNHSTTSIVATPPAIDEQQKGKNGSSSDDSSSSDEIPSHIQVPSGPCLCECNDHLDKVESEIQLPISAKRLYDLLFDSQDIAIWESKNNAGGGTNLRVGTWESVDGKSQRILKYILPVNNPMVKLKEAEVVETQYILKKEEYIRYVVQISTKTAQLPYADAFIPSVKYCISWVSRTQCKLTCSMGVKFVKSVLVKGMISKAALKGMGDSIVSFVPILEEKAIELNGNKASADQPLVRTSTLSRQSHVSTKESPRKSATSSSSTSSSTSPSNSSFDIMEWINTITETVSAIPFTIRAGLTGLFVLWILWSWLFRSSSKSDEFIRPLSPQPDGRAVYLRDLENGLLNTELQPTYVDAESFQLFLTTRPMNGTVTHQWFNPKHRRMAVELLFSRERVAMLRHDMLVIFQMLNQIDAQLLENEYINWLLDTRLICRSSNEPCENVHIQLKSFFG